MRLDASAESDPVPAAPRPTAVGPLAVARPPQVTGLRSTSFSPVAATPLSAELRSLA